MIIIGNIEQNTFKVHVSAFSITSDHMLSLTVMEMFPVERLQTTWKATHAAFQWQNTVVMSLCRNGLTWGYKVNQRKLFLSGENFPFFFNPQNYSNKKLLHLPASHEDRNQCRHTVICQVGTKTRWSRLKLVFCTGVSLVEHVLCWGNSGESETVKE